MAPTTDSPTSHPQIPIVFVLFWIIGIILFGEYVDEINSKILNENVFNCAFDFKNDYNYGILSLTSIPTN